MLDRDSGGGVKFIYADYRGNDVVGSSFSNLDTAPSWSYL
jgi:hypothetical protein